jgi:alpha-tubulin suppressor-like RCC1 family protein
MSDASSAATDVLLGVWAMGRNSEGQLLNGGELGSATSEGASSSEPQMPALSKLLLESVSASRAVTSGGEIEERPRSRDSSTFRCANRAISDAATRGEDGKVADVACGRYFSVVLMSHGQVCVCVCVCVFVCVCVCVCSLFSLSLSLCL